MLPTPGFATYSSAMSELVLYGRPETASFAPRVVLEHVGVPYRFEHAESTSAAYRSLNPAGTVPTLTDGPLVLYETIAILLHLSDRFPQAGLMPPVGTSDRGLAYRQLAFLSNGLMGAMYRWFKADEYIDPGHADALRAGARASSSAFGERIERDLDGREWLVGEGVSAADLLLAMLASWAPELDGLVLGGPNVAGHAARVGALEAWQRVVELEQQ